VSAWWRGRIHKNKTITASRDAVVPFMPKITRVD